jgi:hypothetical protein
MLATTHPLTTTGPRSARSRSASFRRSPQRPSSRRVSRFAARKLASGFFRSEPAPRARSAAAQVTETHQENSVTVVTIVLGCAVDPKNTPKWDSERCGKLKGFINNLLSETGKMIGGFDEFRQGYRNLIGLSYVGQTFSVASFGTAVRSLYRRAIKNGRSAVAGMSGEIIDYGDDYAARGLGWTGRSWDPKQVMRDHDRAAFQSFAFNGAGDVVTEAIRGLAGDALLSAALLDAAGFAEKTIERGNAVLDAASAQLSSDIRGNHSMVRNLQATYDQNCK